MNPDPVATSNCPASAIAHRDAMLLRAGLPVGIFAKGTLSCGGYGLPRGPVAHYREVVIALMFTTRDAQGRWIGIADIGNSIGTGQATIVHAVKRLSKNVGVPYPARQCDGSPADRVSTSGVSG